MDHKAGHGEFVVAWKPLILWWDPLLVQVEQLLGYQPELLGECPMGDDDQWDNDDEQQKLHDFWTQRPAKKFKHTFVSK